MNQLVNLKCVILIPLMLACFALTPTPNAFGVTPAPDGGYVNFNTAEGTDALFSLTTGQANTAIGYQALHNNKTGNDNTANGYQALYHNTTGFDNTAIGFQALDSNGSGPNNLTGSDNTAIGSHSLSTNKTGNNNTATRFLGSPWHNRLLRAFCSARCQLNRPRQHGQAESERAGRSEQSCAANGRQQSVKLP